MVVDLGCPAPLTGNLQKWADQGVLLLNNILTVAEGKPMSHKDHGWEELTDEILLTVLQNAPHIVLVAWGEKRANKVTGIRDFKNN